MSETAAQLRDLLVERAALVGKLTAANAEHLRLLQRAAGAEIELAGQVRSAGAAPASHNQAGLRDADQRDTEAKQAVQDFQLRLTALEQRIDEIDRKIAQA